MVKPVWETHIKLPLFNMHIRNFQGKDTERNAPSLFDYRNCSLHIVSEDCYPAEISLENTDEIFCTFSKCTPWLLILLRLKVLPLRTAFSKI